MNEDKKGYIDTDSHTELGWLWLSVFRFCSVHGESVLLNITEVAAYKKRFDDRWVVKTGFCQRDLGQTHEQQRHFNE